MVHDKRFVRDAFASIAPRYDLLNTLLSGGVEIVWRRHAVRALQPERNDRVLDLCAGTLTLSQDILKREPRILSITSVDFCVEMLLLGSSRLAPWQEEKIFPVTGDAEAIPAASDSFDSAIVTYGIRNLADREAGIRELFRVLKPGGRLVILDFLQPSAPVISTLYGFYLKRILPLIGGAVSGSSAAYRHLSDSIEGFISAEALCALLEGAGFRQVNVDRLSFGIAGLFTARKPN
ncbi:MAG: ubiquinone/menaquinone biosynthesis methyltransferase [Planctomycetota bacterium]